MAPVLTQSMKALPKHDSIKAISDRAVEAAERSRGKFQESMNSCTTKSLRVEKECVAPFHVSEIIFGQWLGEGEFSEIYEVQSLRLSNYPGDDIDAEESNIRSLMKQGEKYRQSGKARYAIKHLKEDYLANHDESEYLQAAR